MRKLACLLVLVSLSACVAVATDPAPVPAPARANGQGKSQGHGPPPHAPAHGYRAKTAQGVEIVFDTQIGVYVVVELPGHYWLDDHYYRKGTSGWVVSASVDGPWVVCPPDDLPPGLRSGPAKNGKSKKAKRDDDD